MLLVYKVYIYENYRNSAIGTYHRPREKNRKQNNKREGSENAETLERDLGDTHTGVHFNRGHHFGCSQT